MFMRQSFRRTTATLLVLGTIGLLAACGSGTEASLAAETELTAIPSGPITEAQVTPFIVDDPGPGGNVTCEQLGYEFSSARVNYGGDGFDATFPAGVNVSTDGTYVTWSSSFAIGAVIVKGGPTANVYAYDPASIGDAGLAAPINPNSPQHRPYGLSNLTFCWDGGDEEPELDLVVSKTASTHFERNWAWRIGKIESNETSAVQLGPEGYVAQYALSVWLTPMDSGWSVSGSITIKNVSEVDTHITSVDDEMSGGLTALVDCGLTISDETPYLLAAGAELVCTYERTLPDGEERTNTATVTTTDGTFGGSTSVMFADPEPMGVECVQVWDNFGTGDPDLLADFTFLANVCYDADDGVVVKDLNTDVVGLDYTVVDGKVLFTYQIDLGDATPVDPPCVYDFTNAAKLRFQTESGWVLRYARWTIEVTLVDFACDDGQPPACDDVQGTAGINLLATECEVGDDDLD
jgi:hypothetical protein